MKLNDLYSKQEAENQPVNVDVEDDDTKESSEMAGIDTKSDATESATEQGPDLEGEFEEVGPSKEIVAMEMDKTPPPKPKEPEAMETKPSSRHQSLTLLPKPSQQSENHFSDISDASDGETEAQEDREPPSSQSQAPSSSLLPLQQSLLIQARPVNGMIPMPALGGEEQKKPSSEQKLVKTRAQLPTFASIPSRSPRERREKGEWRKPESKHSLEDVIMVDSQPATTKDHSQQVDSSLRVISSYPVSGTPPGVTVTSPGQDHRHSSAQSKRSNSPLPGNKPGSVLSSSSEYSPFKTLVNVAASKEYMTSGDTNKKEMPHRHQGKTNTNFSMRVLTGEESKGSNKETKSDPKYVSSRPSSLTPDSKHAHGSPSPTTMRYQFTEQQAASLPPFEASPVPTIVKPHHSATLGYGPLGVDPISLSHGKEEAHDSDSSGSGSILSTHIRTKKTGSRKKRAAQPLIGVKDSKVLKEESGLRQPETPALAPMPFTAFNVKIQPISPGIDTPLHQQQQQLRKESPSVVSMPHLPPPPEMSTKKMKVSSPKPKQPTVGEYMENLPSLRGITASSEPGNHHHHILPNSITQTLAKDSKSTAISSPSSAFTAASVSHKLGEGHPMTTMVPGPAGINPGAKQPDALPFAYTMHQQHTKLQQGGSSSITPAVIQTAVNDNSQMESKTHSPSGGSGAGMNGRRPRKRKSTQDILMEPSKRSPPTHTRERDVEEIMDHRPPPPPPPSLFLSSNNQQLPKQIVDSFMSNEENKEKLDKVKREHLPPGFEYDPHLPMSMQYQLIAFENQQKQAQLRKFHEEYQQHLNEQRIKKEELEKESARMKSLPQTAPRHNHRAPKKQKSSEMLNPPRAHSPNPQMMFPPQRNMSPPTPPEAKPLHGHRHSHMGVHSQAQPIIIPGQEKPHSIHPHHYGVLGPVKTEHQDHMKHVHKLSSPTSSMPSVFQNHTPTIQHHSKPRQDISRKQPTLKKPEQHHVKMEEHVPQMWPSVQMISGVPHFHPHHHPPHSHSQLSIATTSPTVATIPIQTHSSGHFMWPTVSMNPGSFPVKLSEKISRPETSAPMGVITKPHGSGNDLLPPRNPSHMRRSPSPIQKKSPSHATEWSMPSFMVSPISTAAPSYHHHHPKPQVSQSERRRENVPRPFPGGQQGENKPRIHQPHLHQHQHHGATSSHGSSSQAHKTHKPPEQSMGIQPQVHVALPQVSTIQQPSLSPNAAAAAAQMKPQLVAGIPPNINPAMAEEWMKQMQMMQQLTAMGPEAVAAWQQQMAAIAAAQMGVAGMQVDPNVILALQQQQQQNEAMAANLQAAAMAQNMNMIQFMHPTAMVPHPLGPGFYAADPNVLGKMGV